MSTPPVNILVADDHELLREGIKSRLEKHPGWKVCGEAANGREAVELALRLRPDLVVMDIGMKELNGLDAARQIHKEAPEIRVLILTMHDADHAVRDALAAGVRGYVMKTDAAQLLPLAVEALLAEKTFFPSVVSDMLLAGFRNAPATAGRNDGQLTARESEIVQLVAESRTSKEIAIRLGVSVKTIDAHRANIMRKLKLHSVADLVRYAIRNRIAEA